MTQATNYDAATQTAREYYNSNDADTFYAVVWGGEDIHVGLYQSDTEPIADASRRTVDHMADRVAPITEQTHVLDLGAGYGGAARRLVDRFGCKVTCVNLSEAENERNRAANKAGGFADKIDVIDASFDETPCGDKSIDIVWSEDAFLHASDRAAVFDEIDRVLKPGGKVVFTDPMRTDDCPAGVLDPILARIHLNDLGHPSFYKAQADRLGWTDGGFEAMPEQLTRHYTRVLETTEAHHASGALEGKVSDDYLSRMKKGLTHWIDGGKAGHLMWGIFLFEKP